MLKQKFILAMAFSTAAGSAMAFENVDFTNAAEATVNSVVSIKSFSSARSQQYMNPFESDPFFEYFFGPGAGRNKGKNQSKPQQEPELRESGLGSGVIISSDGFIVTNNHVIEGAEKLEITLNDNRTFEGTVIGTDPGTDLALIQIDADSLSAITMGDSEQVKVGEWVLAVGNPFGLTSTVTAGIISAKARNVSSVTGTQQGRVESYLQTDAAVNPGNSGGALVNLKGELIGINSAIYSQTGNYAGNSFAIPTTIVNKVIDDLRQYGVVQRAYLGLRYGVLTPQLAREKGISATAGLYVSAIEPNSAAEEAGIQEGDVIVSIDGRPATTTGELQELMARHRPGDTVAISVLRDNSPIAFSVTLRNIHGDTDVTKPMTFSDLGCDFERPDEKTLKRLGLSGGLQVKNVTEGRFRDAGIRDGFIILDINNARVTSAAEVEQLYNAIVESDEYDHVMFITGIYPGAKRKQFYAVDLTE